MKNEQSADKKLREDLITKHIDNAREVVINSELHLDFQETEIKKHKGTKEELANMRAKVVGPLKEKIEINTRYIKYLEGLK